MPVKEFNKEVLYSHEKVVQVSAGDIAALKEKAMANDRKRVRLCSHVNVDDKLHEMLIVHTHGTYIRPHKHFNKSESFHVIEGLVDVVLFHDNGDIHDVLSMGDYASGRKFYYRIADPVYHSLIIHSPFLVFHETTNGPFNRSETEFAPWSPDELDSKACQEYQKQLLRDVAAFHKAGKT
jgi:cupin fold WbuC family metalloprotein